MHQAIARPPSLVVFRRILACCLLLTGAALPLQAWAVDTDGDGVDDSIDAFPGDPCAATDTDHDGMPDSFLSCTPTVVGADGFETGNFTALPWIQPNFSAWSVQSSYKKSGTYAAKSGSGTPLQLTLTLPRGGQITFSAMISGGGGYTNFSIDGVEYHSMYSGHNKWQMLSYSVAAGTHTFKWALTQALSSYLYLDDVSVVSITNLVEDTDDDNDGVLDTGDNCPLNANADRLNTDGDAQGNACDTDDDNDGVPDYLDPEPFNPANSSVWPLDGVYHGSSVLDGTVRRKK